MKEQPTDPKPSPRLRGPLFFVGSAALLTAMVVDFVAVIGRHAGFSILGSIEMVQAAMLLSSLSALVAASLAEKHARVHLLVDRLGIRSHAVLMRVNALLTALFFLALAGGSLWIASDLRHGHEVSELLGIPYAPLRIACVVTMLALVVIALYQAGRKSPQ